MTRRAWWMIAVLALGAAACGSDESVATTTMAAPTTTAPSELKAKLLTVDDLVGVEGDWSVMADMTPDDLGSLAESPCPDAAIDPQIVERMIPTDAVIFEPTDEATRGVQELILAGDPEQLASDLEVVFGSVESCVGQQYEVPGSGEKVQYDLVDVPEFGDQRSAARLVAFEPPDFTTTWRGHTAIVRVGGVVIMINEFQILDSPDAEPFMDDAEFVALLESAVARLGG